MEIEKGCFGSFTARLISGLIEDHSTQTDPFEFEDIPGKNGNGTVLKNLSLGNCVLLEKRIKKELEDNGLLELSDALSGDSLEEDEILKELTKCQSDLRMVTAQNKSTLKLLLSKSKQNLAKQEIKKKVQAADTEVTDTYRRFVIAKQKKRNLTKKEKDMVSASVVESCSAFNEFAFSHCSLGGESGEGSRRARRQVGQSSAVSQTLTRHHAPLHYLSSLFTRRAQYSIYFYTTAASCASS